MSEHRQNQNAIISAMLPRLPDDINYNDVRLAGSFAIKPTVLIVAPENIRTNQNGKQELRESPPSTAWSIPPDSITIVPEGTKLGFHHLDFVIHIICAKIDKRIINKSGQPIVTFAPLAELVRIHAPNYLSLFSTPPPVTSVTSLTG